MKKYSALIMPFLLFLSFFSYSGEKKTHRPYQYDWAVVGAGFAGITALAVLLDSGVKASKVVWIDPEFNVGRVGKYYGNVPGNIQIQSVLYYVNNCPFLKNIPSPALKKLYEYNLETYPLLQAIVDPLQDFTNYLRKNVASIEDNVSELIRIDNYWTLHTADVLIKAKKVILGSP